MKVGLSVIVLAVAAFAADAAERKSFEVRPRAFYEATFRARVAEGPTLERNPQLAEAVSLTVGRPSILTGRPFAYVQWTFGGGSDGRRPSNGSAPFTLYSGEWKSFTYRFYAPDGATRVEPKVVNGKGVRGELADVVVRELPPTAMIIPHPGFDDPFASPGWQLRSGAQYRLDRDGPFVMMEGASVVSNLFPVEPGQRLEVVATGEPPRFSATSRTNARLTYYASSDDLSLKNGGTMVPEAASVIRDMEPVGRRSYTVPEGMRWASVSVWNGSVRRVEVTAK